MRITVILAAAVLAIPEVAFAGVKGEPIRLVVDAPSGCVTESELVAEVERLGMHVPIADEGERARRFDVTIACDGDHFVARLAVRDLVGRETVRSVTNDTCVDAGRAASLLVSLALDEEPETTPPPRVATLYRWPQPVLEDAPIPPARPTARPKRRLGSGGLVVSGVYGWRNGRSGTEVHGARAYAGWRLGVTRFGAAIAVERDTDALPGTYPPANKRGTSGRVGAVVGWGAPWNDSVAGFVGEVGVAAGATEFQQLGYGETLTKNEFYGSPYAGGWLVLQLPWKHPVRPVVGLGTVWTPVGPDLPLAVVGDLGVAWQAW